MAATLAMSFLGHILFLKSQVPFPVMQLARMPGGQSDSRAAKRRMELLAAIDTLSSHMRTTFTALSTALALRKTGTGEAGPPSTGAAHLAFVLGPSVGAARARIVYAVDGLDVRVWGERDDLPGPSRRPRSEESEEGEDENSGSEEGPEGGREEPEGDAEDPEASEDDALQPPVSRSPSPSPSPSPPTSHSHAASPTRELAENIAPVATPRRANTYPPTAPRPPAQTYAEEQQALRVAERLLSRTLANACAEESGGMSSELAPTQTHVLLRAPRRFAHPAWIPRQNLTRSLEGMLQSFLDDVCVRDDAAQARKSKGAKTEGVIVGCRREGVSEGVRLGGRGDAEDEDEEDEMIWWVWDGKIVGFADW
ncbi:hypothetical protein FOMPIDRAFT_1024075 [Fomitopsis schrenkii]|uniref:Uncharacterized protein n=1 Tax=Fomitopsis schrenkii TaxID=2126942 RepID=S8E504_FOMSC|nr:hypothetical protein FOMPIDRAFT_1026600 [Fomitopsis schrenkii]EPS99802.1 hypothetical protein FOMPIDRAFT_1024075 [Fomitopsis schrenkii]